MVVKEVEENENKQLYLTFIFVLLETAVCLREANTLQFARREIETKRNRNISLRITSSGAPSRQDRE